MKDYEYFFYQYLEFHLSNNKRSFNLAAYKNDTELSNEFRKIKRRNSVPQIKWRILKECSRVNRSSLRYNLCLNVKLEIALFKGNNVINRLTSSQRCI